MNIEIDMTEKQRTSSSGDVELEDAPLMGHAVSSRGYTDHNEERRNRQFLTLSLVLFCLSFVFMCISITSMVMSLHMTPAAALKASQLYSPILDEIDLRVSDTRLNGSLWLGEHPNVWRGLPTESTNAAWNVFDTNTPIVISAEQVRKIGKDPETAAKFDNDYWGFGDDAYMGALDFIHQAHCLNQLRIEAFRGWDGPIKEQDYGSLHWVHLRHCTDMLMQHLLCTGDTGIITYNWYEDAQLAFPDMSVNRKCRDWTQLLDYQEKHNIDVEKLAKYTKPAGVRELKQPPEYWAWKEAKAAKSAQATKDAQG